jgi:predicted ATPase
VAFPRERSVERRSHNLPLERTSFVGRKREVAEVERLLFDRQLVTLCGPGGAGKTRLALAVARGLAEGFEGGAWWAELAPLSNPDLVPGAVARALGVTEAPDRSPTEELVEYLRTRQTLLILDNCEHLVEACAVLADTLLEACPDVKILGTSREPLRVAGETSFMVPGLSLPDPGRSPSIEELAAHEAVGLFVERAGEVDSGFALTESNAPAVARLCERELGVIRALARGMSDRQIAHALGISEKTVRNHTSNIYRKLHIFDRTQAVIYAVREGVIDVGDLEYRPPREPSPQP